MSDQQQSVQAGTGWYNRRTIHLSRVEHENGEETIFGAHRSVSTSWLAAESTWWSNKPNTQVNGPGFANQ